MIGWLRRGRRARYRINDQRPAPRLVMPESCLVGLIECLLPANARRHEGVAFLIGRICGETTIAIQSVRPNAITTPGSFFVPAAEMAKVVGIALDQDMQVVAQVHTHPGDAFHSDGDEDGAKIRYPGFFSIVLPDYGDRLPATEGAAVYLCRENREWEALTASVWQVSPAWRRT